MTNEQRVEFQKAHGPAWYKIINLPSFGAGMVHINIDTLEKIRLLTDEDIASKAVVILSDLRGRLLHESALFSLPEPPEEPEPELIEEVVDQVKEFNEEQNRRNNPRNRKP